MEFRIDLNKRLAGIGLQGEAAKENVILHMAASDVIEVREVLRGI